MSEVTNADAFLRDYTIHGEILSEPLLNEYSIRGRGEAKDETGEPAYIHSYVGHCSVKRDRRWRGQRTVQGPSSKLVARCLERYLTQQLDNRLLRVLLEISI